MTLVRRNFLRLACGAIAGSVVAPDVRAQSYPARPIRLVVSVAAGGTNDVTARMIAQKLTEAWGQQVFVDNVPGGGEIVGTGQVAKAEPNGYTALFATGAFTLNPSLHSKLPYDTLKDFTPVTLVASGPHALTVHPSVPAKDVNELVALVRANPGKYSFASSGANTQPRLVGELFKLKFGLDLVHVPFNGGGPAMTSTIGGHTPIAFTSLGNAAPEHQGRQAAGAGADQRAAPRGIPGRADHGRSRAAGVGHRLDAGRRASGPDAQADRRPLAHRRREDRGAARKSGIA